MFVYSTTEVGAALGYTLKITVEPNPKPVQFNKVPAACRQQLDVLAKIDFDAGQQRKGLT